MTVPRKVKALYLNEFVKSISDLQITSIPLKSSGRNDLVIQITHVAPTHVDILYAQGLHQNNRRHAKPPFVIGSDFAGIIVSAPESSHFRKGQRVYGSAPGAFAEYLIVDAKTGATGIRVVPEVWSNHEACSVGASAAISIGAFASAGDVRPGQWILVTGASGGLGIQAVQIARAKGAKVIALVGGEEKATVLRSIGADVCVRYDQKNWEAAVKEAADGKGVHLVYDAVGFVESSLKCCRYGGIVIIVGFAGRHGEMEAVKMNRILLKGASVIGYRFGEHGRQDPAAVMQIWRAYDKMVVDGQIKAVPFTEVYNGINELPKAMLNMEKGKVWGRAVVTVHDTTGHREAAAKL